MASGPEGKTMPSRRGRIYDCICSNSCAIQEPLDVAGGSIYDNASARWRATTIRISRLKMMSGGRHSPQSCMLSAAA
jgi:hypothetical protein